MTDGGQSQEFGVEWRRLQAAQLELRQALGKAGNDEDRERLKAQLLSARKALLRLEEHRTTAAGEGSPADQPSLDPLEEPIERPSASGGTARPTGDELTAQPVVRGEGVAAAGSAGPSNDTGDAAGDDSGSDRETGPGSDHAIDELLEELVYRHERPAQETQIAGQPPEPEGAVAGGSPDNPPVPAVIDRDEPVDERPPGRSPAVMAAGAIVAIIVLAVFAGVAALFWSLGNQSGSTGDVEVNSASASTPPPTNGQVDDLRRALGTLGLSEVEAELRGSVLRLAGTVPSDDDRQSVIDAARASVGDVEIDAESLQVATASLPDTIRIALVAPGARDDMAFTQSMVDALGIVSEERGQIELFVADSVGGADAAATISDLAIEGYDLVIAHSSTFRSLVSTIAREHPDVTFAVGPVDDQPVRSNVYTYGVAAEQGGFVLGALAARLSTTGVIGAVGPVEAGVSERYIEAFRAGAQSELPEIAVLVSYTGSFSDSEAAAASTAELLTAGADVITGQGYDMSEAMAAVRAAGARWLGNQVNQASVEPTAVVASQVYHWEVVLRSIIEDVDNGVSEGRNHRADLANGGVVIELNPDLRPSAADLDRIDELVADAGLDAPVSN